MPHIQRQRDIIDRRRLGEELAALAGDEALPERRQFLPPLKAAYAAGTAEIRRRFEADGNASRAVREQSFLVDQLIRTLHDFVAEHVYPLANPTSGERLAIVAVGGYGRGELAPYSDIDLLFLLPYKQTPHTEQVVEYLLYMLWDLGLKVGQATRSVADCLRYARQDLTIRTSLLEARYVWGEQSLYNELKQRFDAEIVRGTAAQFVEAKLAERDARHQRVGDSRYQLEPLVKEGKAGSETCTRCSGSPNTSTASTTLPGWSSAACCRPRNRSASNAPRRFCGRCAAICTISPAAPRSASPSTARPRSAAAWAIPTTPARAGSSAS